MAYLGKCRGEGRRGGLQEWLLWEAFPMSNRTNSRWIQDGPAARPSTSVTVAAPQGQLIEERIKMFHNSILKRGLRDNPRTPAGAGGCPNEVVTPWEAGSWQDLWSHGVPTLEQFIPEGLHSVEGTHASSPWEGSMLEKFTEEHLRKLFCLFFFVFNCD